jgi:cell wall assembly regulator SMI1
VFIQHVAVHLHRRAASHGWEVRIGAPASDEDLQQAESRLGVQFPEQMKVFYRHYDGLSVAAPAIVVHRLADLSWTSPSALRFATLDNQHDLHLDTSHLNVADQWDVVSSDNGEIVTRTWASFWSNKLWAWVDKGRAIWGVDPRGPAALLCNVTE